jgi:hypothetical protein
MPPSAFGSPGAGVRRLPARESAGAGWPPHGRHLHRGVGPSALTRFPLLFVESSPPHVADAPGESATARPTRRRRGRGRRRRPAGGEPGRPAERRPAGAQVLGPGLVTGASDDDPSGIATYAAAGAAFGYATLWTALVTFP